MKDWVGSEERAGGEPSSSCGSAVRPCWRTAWITDGPWKGRKMIGCSLVIGPEGEEILQGPYGVEAEAVLEMQVAPVPRPARGCGWEDIGKTPTAP